MKMGHVIKVDLTRFIRSSGSRTVNTEIKWTVPLTTANTPDKIRLLRNGFYPTNGKWGRVQRPVIFMIINGIQIKENAHSSAVDLLRKKTSQHGAENTRFSIFHICCTSKLAKVRTAPVDLQMLNGKVLWEQNRILMEKSCLLCLYKRDRHKGQYW